MTAQLTSTPTENARGRVAGRTAIVTGAGAGIGRAIALRLAAEGASVLAVDIDADGLATTAASHAGTAPFVTRVVDVMEEAPVAEMVAFSRCRLGPIDILVNNVGGGRRPGHIWDARVEDFDFVLRLNLRTAFLCTRAVVGEMMERRSGRVINISSGSRKGLPWLERYTGGSVSYSTSKAGVQGFTSSVALELAEYGITVNAVAPGPTASSDRAREVLTEMGKDDYGPTKLTPMRRLGLPSEMADAVLFLASDEAAYITGIVLDVAGGY